MATRKEIMAMLDDLETHSPNWIPQIREYILELEHKVQKLPD